MHLWLFSPGKELKGQSIVIPGDISSAAFWLVAGSIIPGSELIIENVGLNPTRTGILKVLEEKLGEVSYVETKPEYYQSQENVTLQHNQNKN